MTREPDVSSPFCGATTTSRMCAVAARSTSSVEQRRIRSAQHRHRIGRFRIACGDVRQTLPRPPPAACAPAHRACSPRRHRRWRARSARRPRCGAGGHLACLPCSCPHPPCTRRDVATAWPRDTACHVTGHSEYQPEADGEIASDVGGLGEDGVMSDVLDRFTPATQDWFRGAFAAPTPAQEGAWNAISAGRHALVVAPTGSGKTLSAFLWAIDSVFRERALRQAQGPTSADAPPKKDSSRTRILYISPLKALGVDVERNLRAPLVGIKATAAHLGARRLPQVTGRACAPATPRRATAASSSTDPPDILITTPESLYLMLTAPRPRDPAPACTPSSSTRCTRSRPPSAVPTWRRQPRAPRRNASPRQRPRERRAADRPLGDRASDRRGGPLPRRRRSRSSIVAPAGHPRPASWASGVPVEDMTDPPAAAGGSDRPRRPKVRGACRAHRRSRARSGRTSRRQIVDLHRGRTAPPSSSPTRAGSPSG